MLPHFLEESKLNCSQKCFEGIALYCTQITGVTRLRGYAPIIVNEALKHPKNAGTIEILGV